MKKFPSLKDSLYFIGTVKDAPKALEIPKKLQTKFKKQIKLKPGESAAFLDMFGEFVDYSGIYLSDDFNADKIESFKKYVEKANKDNWQVSKTPVDLIVHEIGHAVHRSLAFTTGLNNELKQIFDTLNKSEITKGVSEYASENFKEFVAETFTEHYTSKNPRPIAKMVGEVFEKYGKR